MYVSVIDLCNAVWKKDFCRLLSLATGMLYVTFYCPTKSDGCMKKQCGWTSQMTAHSCLAVVNMISVRSMV